MSVRTPARACMRLSDFSALQGQSRGSDSKRPHNLPPVCVDIAPSPASLTVFTARRLATLISYLSRVGLLMLMGNWPLASVITGRGVAELPFSGHRRQPSRYAMVILGIILASHASVLRWQYAGLTADNSRCASYLDGRDFFVVHPPSVAVPPLHA